MNINSSDLANTPQHPSISSFEWHYSYWFILTIQNDDFIYQSINKYCDNGMQVKSSIAQILPPDMDSDKRHKQFKRCFETQTARKFDEITSQGDNIHHWQTELFPLFNEKNKEQKIVGHSQYKGDIELAIPHIDDDAFVSGVLQSIHRQIELSIGPLKTSTHLLCEANRDYTKLFLAELVNSSISELETTAKDINLLNSTLDQLEIRAHPKRFLLCATLANIEISKQTLLSQKNIEFSLFSDNIKSIHITGVQEYFEQLFDKLLKLILTWCTGSRVTLSTEIKLHDSGEALLIEVNTNKLNLPDGISVMDIQSLINGHNHKPNLTRRLPVLDILIYQKLLNQLKAQTQLKQYPPSYYVLNIVIPIEIN